MLPINTHVKPRKLITNRNGSLQVTRDTELSFEYQVRSRTERQALGLRSDSALFSRPTHGAAAAAFLDSLWAPPPRAHSTGPPVMVAPPVPPSAPPSSTEGESKKPAFLPFQVWVGTVGWVRSTCGGGTVISGVLTPTSPGGDAFCDFVFSCFSWLDSFYCSFYYGIL